MSNESKKTEVLFDPQVLVEEAKRALDLAHPGPSREKSLVHTKLDEALLWLTRVTTVIAFIAASSCATLSDIASIDWHKLMDDVSNKYALVSGPLFKLCSELEPGNPLDGACELIGTLDIAAQSSIGLADIAVATGDDISDRVQQAQAQVDKLTAAFEALQKAKAHAPATAISADARSKTGAPAARNPYREKAAAIRGAILFPDPNPYTSAVPSVAK